MLYVLKQLTNEDIELLSKELMMEVNYHPINLDEEILNYQEINIFKEVLYNQERKKEKRDFKALYATIFAIVFAVRFIIFFCIYEFRRRNIEPKVETTTASKQATSEYIIPDHVHIK